MFAILDLPGIIWWQGSIKFWGPFKDFMKIVSPENYRLHDMPSISVCGSSGGSISAFTTRLAASLLSVRASAVGRKKQRAHQL